MLNHKITTVLISKSKEEMQKIVSNLKEIEIISVVGKAVGLSQAVSVVTNFAPQLVFVCTDLNSNSGLEVVRALHARNIFPEIVFVAENADMAYESLQYEPLDFLVKPVDKELIEEMLVRLKTKLKKKEMLRKMDVFAKFYEVKEKRVFKHKKGLVILKLEEITFFKAELTTTVITLKTGETVKLKCGIKETLETINNDSFIRIGRSYCINRNYLRKIDKRNFKCRLSVDGNEFEIPISKNSIGELEKLNVFPI